VTEKSGHHKKGAFSIRSCCVSYWVSSGVTSRLLPFS